jgi:hypothetical protein
VRETQLLKALAELDWSDVKGMVPPKAQETLLDVVFYTAQGSVRITGKDHILRSGEEAFSLAIYEHVKAGWWAEEESNWTAINLKEQWTRMSLSCLMAGPRGMQFYSDPKLKDCSFPMESLLDNCSAIEFVKAVEGDNKRLVLRASDDCPCAVEVGVGTEACNRLLSDLESIAIAVDG